MSLEDLRLVEVRQRFEAPTVADVSRAAGEQVRKSIRQRNLPSGSRVGITP